MALGLAPPILQLGGGGLSECLALYMYIFCKASRTLEEYEILKEVLEIRSIRNTSQASVKIVFRRRIEYHVTKTFLQVLAIV